MATMKTELIEDTINNPNALVQIIGPGVTVKSWLTKAVSFNGIGSAWTAPFEFTGMQGLVSNIYNVIKGKDWAQVSLQAPAQTILFWKDSSRPKITVDLLFVSYEKGRDPRQDLLQLFKCVAPNSPKVAPLAVLGIKGKVSTIYTAPLGYAGSTTGKEVTGTATRNSAIGTVTLFLGNYFCARNLVVTEVTPGLSVMTTIEGWPLYASASVSLQPYMVPTYEDFCAWFKLVPDVSGDQTGAPGVPSIGEKPAGAVDQMEWGFGYQ